MKKKKKVKINKKKFFSRIILLIIIVLIIISIISNIFKNDEKEELVSLIVNNEDITESLTDDIYIDKDGVLYLSLEDIRNIFDENIFYEEATNKIITTYGTKVGAINIQDDTIEINSAIKVLSATIINYQDTYYIPVSEISSIYNIEVITTDNAAMVFSLYNEQVTANLIKKTSLKEDTSTFSRNNC